MTINEKISERISLYNDAINFKLPKRVPYTMSAACWGIIDSDMGVTLEECTTDFSLGEKATREFLDRYQFDSIYNYPLVYNNKKTKILEPTLPMYMISGNYVNALDREIIETTEDIDEYIKDPAMYMWTHIGPKYYKELTLAQIEDGIRADMEFGQYYMKMNELLGEKGIPRLLEPQYYFQAPVEKYAHGLRGLKNFSVDLRRIPQKIDEYIEFQSKIENAAVDGSVNNAKAEDVIFDGNMSLLTHSLMNSKQFEHFMWEFLKGTYEKFEKANRKCYIFAEAEILRLANFFNEIKKGTLCMHIEMEDVRDARKAMPGVVIEGGMPVTKLGCASAQECVDFTKELIETMGEGYIFSQNKMLFYKNDAKRENMLAVQNAVMNYSC